MATATLVTADGVQMQGDPLPEGMRKLDEHKAWGVMRIWLVTPSIRKFPIFHSGGLTEVDRFELTEFNFDLGQRAFRRNPSIFRRSPSISITAR